MEMLIFYIIAILLSAYETNKEKQECKQKSETGVHDIRNWHLQDFNSFPLSKGSCR